MAARLAPICLCNHRQGKGGESLCTDASIDDDNHFMLFMSTACRADTDMDFDNAGSRRLLDDDNQTHGVASTTKTTTTSFFFVRVVFFVFFNYV